MSLSRSRVDLLLLLQFAACRFRPVPWRGLAHEVDTPSARLKRAFGTLGLVQGEISGRLTSAWSRNTTQTLEQRKLILINLFQ